MGTGTDQQGALLNELSQLTVANSSLKEENGAIKKDMRSLAGLLQDYRGNISSLIRGLTLLGEAQSTDAARECSRRIVDWYHRGQDDYDLVRLLCSCGRLDPDQEFQADFMARIRALPKVEKYLKEVDMESYNQFKANLDKVGDGQGKGTTQGKDTTQGKNVGQGKDTKTGKKTSRGKRRARKHDEDEDDDAGDEDEEPTFGCWQCRIQSASGELGPGDCSLLVYDDGHSMCTQCESVNHEHCRVFCGVCEDKGLEQADPECTKCDYRREHAEAGSAQGDAEQAMSEADEPACYCRRPEFGTMVGCDNNECETVWFHLECTELEKEPGEDDLWLCRDCRPLKGQIGSTGLVANESGMCESPNLPNIY